MPSDGSEELDVRSIHPATWATAMLGTQTRWELLLYDARDREQGCRVDRQPDALGSIVMTSWADEKRESVMNIGRSAFNTALGLLLVTCLLSTVFGIAEAGVLEAWLASYDHAGENDWLTGLVVDADGNVYVTGYAYDPLTSYDFATIKYDGETGAELWVERYDHDGDEDMPYGLALDGAGNLYVTGGSNDPDTDEGPYLTIKYSGETGELVWAKTYGFDGHAWDVDVDEEGDVYVTGRTSPDPLSHAATTIKYDGETGDPIWAVEFANAGLTDLAVDGNGDVYATGWISTPDLGIDFVTVKYDGQTGAQLWVSQYEHDLPFERSKSIVVDTMGNVYATGIVENEESGTDFRTVKYDPETGAEIWASEYTQEISAYSVEDPEDLAVDAAGDVYITGRSTDELTSYDFATIKYDGETGAQLWVKRYDHDGSPDQPGGLSLDAAGDVYVTGGSGDLFSRDVATIKYDGETGAELWVERFDDGYYESGNRVAVDGAGDVYVAGGSFVLNEEPGLENGDYITIKYARDSDDDGIPDGVDNCPLDI